MYMCLPYLTSPHLTIRFPIQTPMTMPNPISPLISISIAYIHITSILKSVSRANHISKRHPSKTD